MPGDRTEQATQHRRDKARKEGDILHSRELTAAAGTLAGVVALGLLGSRSLLAWRQRLCGISRHWASRRTGSRASLRPPWSALRRLALACFSAGRHDHGRCGRGRACRRAGADRRAHRFMPKRSGFKLDRINPLCECQKPFLSAGRGAPGQVADSGGHSRHLRGAAHRAAVDDSAVFDRAPGDAGLRCLRAVAGRGVAAVRLGGGRLPG